MVLWHPDLHTITTQLHYNIHVDIIIIIYAYIAAATAPHSRRSKLSKPVRAPETLLRSIMRKIYIMCVGYMYIIINYTYIYTVTPRGEPAKATRSLGFVRAAFLLRTVIIRIYGAAAIRPPPLAQF